MGSWFDSFFGDSDIPATIAIISSSFVIILLITNVLIKVYLSTYIKARRETFPKEPMFMRHLKAHDPKKYNQFQRRFRVKKALNTVEKSLDYVELITIQLSIPELVNLLWLVKSFDDLDKKKPNTVVGMMLEDKLSSSLKSTRLLVIVIIGYSACFGLELLPISIYALIIPLVLLTALYLDQYLVIYRVRKGWYGRNEYEAREIINYVISHANKDDFNDEGGLKKLMDAPEREEHKASEIEGWVQA